jgi:hypothetical protein
MVALWYRNGRLMVWILYPDPTGMLGELYGFIAVSDNFQTTSRQLPENFQRTSRKLNTKLALPYRESLHTQKGLCTRKQGVCARKTVFKNAEEVFAHTKEILKTQTGF